MPSKSLSRVDLIKQAIRSYKLDHPDWKDQTRDDMYGIESYIDGLLYEKKFRHLAPDYGALISSRDEIVLERLTFDAIKVMSGRRSQSDTYYDDAFDGYDCMTEVVEHKGKEHKRSKKKVSTR